MRRLFFLGLVTTCIAASASTPSFAKARITEEPAGSQSFTLTLTEPPAKSPNPSEGPQTLGGISLGGGTRSLTCNVTVDNPHYSNGAAGMIAKVKYSCMGNMSGTLRASGNIYRYKPGEYGPYAPRASNTGSAAVGPLAASTLMYLPAAPGGIHCNMNHWYYADAYLTLVAGPSANSTSVTSATVHPQKCA